MPELSGIYDSGPMQPVFRMKDTLAILSQGKYVFKLVEFQEPYPASEQTVVDILTIAPAATFIAANGGTVAKRVVQIVQINADEFLHLRFRPLDPLQGVLWEPAGVGRFNAANVHCRVSRRTAEVDPHWASTTFFILADKEDMNLETFNPTGFALPAARFQFWGDRNVVSSVDLSGITEDERKKMERGDRDLVKRHLGVVTWIPARASL